MEGPIAYYFHMDRIFIYSRYVSNLYLIMASLADLLYMSVYLSMSILSDLYLV